MIDHVFVPASLVRRVKKVKVWPFVLLFSMPCSYANCISIYYYYLYMAIHLTTCMAYVQTWHVMTHIYHSLWPTSFRTVAWTCISQYSIVLIFLAKIQLVLMYGCPWSDNALCLLDLANYQSVWW
jgi:hypothetical protein